MFSPALLTRIADTFGTPCFVYSADKLDAQCSALKQAFAGSSTQACFAVKANSTGAILRRIFQHGFGADVVSGGELERALRAGAKGNQIVFSGVGKQDWEIALGLKHGVYFNTESLGEIARIGAAAKDSATPAKVLLRVNPNIPVDTNPYIATGLYATKFGIAENQITEAAQLARSLPGLSLVGLSCHLGSQLTDISVFRSAAERMVSLGTALKEGRTEFTRLDLGGGLAVRYDDETPPSVAEYAAAVLGPVQKAGFTLVLEPGRWLVAEAGQLLTRTIAVKATPEKTFVVVDAAMNDLIRPSLYEAYHPISPVIARTGPTRKVDIVGPVCETGDFLGLDRELSPIESGDLLIVGVCGAYGSTMASTYNSRPRAAEVMVSSGEPELIRKRESISDLWAQEI